MDFGLRFCVVVLYVQTVVCASGPRYRRLNEKLVLLESRLNVENEQRHQDYENLMSKLDEMTTKLDIIQTKQNSYAENIHDKVGVGGDAKSDIYMHDQMQYVVKGLAELDEMNHRIKRELTRLDSDIKTTQMESNERGDVLSHTIEDLKKHNDEQHRVIRNDIDVMAKTQNENWSKMKSEIANTNVALKEHFERLNDTLEHFVNSRELEDTINTMCKIDVTTNLTKTSIDHLNKSNSTEVEQSQSNAFTSCKDAYDKGHQVSGIIAVYNHGTEYEVFCDQLTDGGGWTVFQRRQNGEVDFYRDSVSYKKGFGDLVGEFWLGNEYLSAILGRGKHELRIDMEDSDENRAYAKYSTFSIDPETNNYMLHVDGYTGDAGDALAYHNDQRFSTKDLDVDQYSSVSCSKSYKGAWWYNSCHHSNLNGMYNMSSSSQGVVWSKWDGSGYSLKFVEMKFRMI